MVTTNNMRTLHIWDTEYSADSVEWCPISPFQNIFVCGTYQLATTESTEVENRECDDTSKNLEMSEGSAVSNTYKRNGRLYLFAVDSLKGLYLLQTLEMPAILDCKWCHCKINGRILLAVANAVGEVLLYEMHTAGEPKAEEDKLNIKGTEPWLSCTLSLLCSSVIAQDVDSETLALSLDWSTGRFKFEHKQNSPLISVSDSKGYISLLTLTDLMLEKKECWKAHDFEAWITAFDYWNYSIVYTGGDDCKFHTYDIRTGTLRPVFTSSVHEAGVTSLHSNALFEHLLTSGSYDENIRIWDTRHMKHPVYSTPVSGGVWRLKWDPHTWTHLLTACMHGGFFVLDYTDNTKPPFIVAAYKEHQSLAYGSDWCHLVGEEAMIHVTDAIREACRAAEELRIVGTCSFYDHKLCISSLSEWSTEQL